MHNVICVSVDDSRGFDLEHKLDDEVASRHCATLTARSRSPRVAKRFEFEAAKPDQAFPTLSDLNKEKDGANKRPAAATAEDDGGADAKRSRASATNIESA